MVTLYNTPVTGFSKVNQFIILAKSNGLRCLTIRHDICQTHQLDILKLRAVCSLIRTWCFLETSNLLVGEHAAVVNQLHSVFRGALFSRAAGRFSDSSSVDFHNHSLITDQTLEESNLHIGHNRRCTDHQALDRHQLVHI